MRFRGAPGGAPLLLVASLVAAQGPPARYTAAMLEHASFDERVRTTIRTQTGGATRLETVGREARWQVRATGPDSAIKIEAWYDSLLVWRDGPEGRLHPDTDGLVGGRFHGWVSPAGLVSLQSRPFIPDELAEVSDLASAFTTFLPFVPDSALPVGRSRDERGGARIFRRADSTGAEAILQRYRWIRTMADTLREVEADSLGYEIRSTVREEGHLVWHPHWGPIAWHRDVLTEVEIPADGPVRRAVRSRVEERLQGWRRRERDLLHERPLLHTFAHTTSGRPADVGRIPRFR